MDFHRMHGCGNSFAVFDARPGTVEFDEERVREIAAPGGAGVDQVIAVVPSDRAAARMRVWNRDGSAAETCGNAARCIAWLLMREQKSAAITLETGAGVVAAEAVGDGIVAIDMGMPKLGWEEIPLAERMDTRGIDLKFGPIDNPYLHSPGAVGLGNPHVVFFVSDLESVDVAGIGPMVEGHMLFPVGVNAGFAQVLSPTAIRLRVWERGAGLTLSCGSGACAAVVAAARKRLAGRAVSVMMDGGELAVEWREGDGHVVMSGPVTLQASGRI